MHSFFGFWKKTVHIYVYWSLPNCRQINFRPKSWQDVHEVSCVKRRVALGTNDESRNLQRFMLFEISLINKSCGNKISSHFHFEVGSIYLSAQKVIPTRISRYLVYAIYVYTCYKPYCVLIVINLDSRGTGIWWAVAVLACLYTYSLYSF